MSQEAALEPQDSPDEKLGKVVTVRAFGCRLMGGKDAQEYASYIFRTQNRFWNKLVEIEREARASYQDALLESDTELKSLSEKAEQQQLVIDALIDARNAARAKARTKKVESAQNYAAAIREAAQSLKDLRAQMKELKQRAKLAAKPLIEAAEKLRREKVKQAVADSGLWWCHSETVLASFDVARIKAMKEGAQLQFHRYDGEGSMGVRFSVDGGSLEKIYAGSTKLLNFRDPTPEELGRMQAVTGDGGRRKVITLRAGNKAEDGTIPFLSFLVTFHAGREFPTDAPLKTVTLRRDMHVDRPEWKVIFTFSRPATGAEPLPVLPTQAAGIDFGFRLVRDNDGQRGLRVGSISNGERVEHIVLGEQWLSRMERADRHRSEVDMAADTFWSRIKPELKGDVVQGLEDDDWFKVLAGKVLRAKKGYAGLLMDLCRAHERAGSPLGEAVQADMAAFLKFAYKTSLQAHHARRRALDNRKHVFRNIAARLVSTYGLIGIENADFRGMARLEQADGTENELAQSARKYRTWAAPSELRLAIEQAFKREKREIVSVPSADTTRTCSACGHVHGQIEDLMFTCDGCGKVWDQDENAAHNIRKYVLSEQ